MQEHNNSKKRAEGNTHSSASSLPSQNLSMGSVEATCFFLSLAAADTSSTCRKHKKRVCECMQVSVCVRVYACECAYVCVCVCVCVCVNTCMRTFTRVGTRAHLSSLQDKQTRGQKRRHLDSCTRFFSRGMTFGIKQQPRHLRCKSSMSCR